MALDAFALVTLDEAKLHLNIPTANTTQDAILERFINEASGVLDDWTDRELLSRSQTEYQDGRNNNRIVLHQWPVTAVSEVWCDSSSEFTDTTTQLDASEYRISQESEIVLINRMFAKGTHNIKIVYTGGYTTTPRPLESACLWMVEWYYDLRSDLRVGNKSKGKNNERSTYYEDWPAWIVRKVERYKRMEWPLANAPIENR